MIRHGADKVFNSKESTITEDDIDDILARGEKLVSRPVRFFSREQISVHTRALYIYLYFLLGMVPTLLLLLFVEVLLWNEVICFYVLADC